jgi:hypothetical protein
MCCLEVVGDYLPQAKLNGTRKIQLIEELTSALKDTPRFVEELRTSKQVYKNQMICWLVGLFTADVKIVALKIVTRSVHWF